MKSLKNSKTYLGKRGYILRKKYFKKDEIDEMKKELDVVPFVSGDYGKPEEGFKVYLENENKLYIPKFYGIQRFGPPDVNTLSDGVDIHLQFHLELKEEQKHPAQMTMDAYHEKGGGILSLPCGFGKTILALYFISQLKKKTLVVVHKEFLMNQWKERIQFALPGAKIGIIQGDRFEMEGNDILIGMLQTLSMKEFPMHAFDDIGHVIIDECHRIPSRVFSRALHKIHSPYMLGLSATPQRKDGLTKILKWYIGDIIYSVKSDQKNIVRVERYQLDSENEYYNKEVLNYMGKVQMATMINQISDYKTRTVFLVEKILERFRENDKRQILVLSDRKNNLKEIYELMHENGFTSVGYYIGGMKQEKLKESESCKLLLGTFPMANEGLDIPSLNGLVFATPKSDIIQSIGRICRRKHFGIQPLIMDFVDCFSVFEGQARKRFQIYKKNKYEIVDYNYHLEKKELALSKEYTFHMKHGGEQDTESHDSEEETSSLCKSTSLFDSFSFQS
jgi:superfamily II DNA or RNA helicase